MWEDKSRRFQILIIADQYMNSLILYPFGLQGIHLFCRDFMTSRMIREALK